jgi:hypothetical protein
MFTVIICGVKTGRVERKVFDTRVEAEAFLRTKEERLLRRKRPASLGDYRMEIRFSPAPTVHPLPVRQPAIAAA